MLDLTTDPQNEPKPSIGSDHTWKSLTLAANSAWDGGDDCAARDAYRHALQEAERLLALAEQGAGPIKSPMLVVISHHNLAEVALRDGQMDLALSHYQTPFDRLLTLASLRSTPADLRQSCAANLKEATIALVMHLQSTGAHIQAITDIVRRARFVANSATHPATLMRPS
jgi:hypothetical protein